MIEYKGYQIKPHKVVPTAYIVVTAGKGGKIPDILSGVFTGYGVAKLAIDKYLDDKEDLNAKTRDKSRN